MSSLYLIVSLLAAIATCSEIVSIETVLSISRQAKCSVDVTETIIIFAPNISNYYTFQDKKVHGVFLNRTLNDNKLYKAFNVIDWYVTATNVTEDTTINYIPHYNIFRGDPNYAVVRSLDSVRIDINVTGANEKSLYGVNMTYSSIGPLSHFSGNEYNNYTNRIIWGYDMHPMITNTTRIKTIIKFDRYINRFQIESDNVVRESENDASTFTIINYGTLKDRRIELFFESEYGDGTRNSEGLSFCTVFDNSHIKFFISVFAFVYIAITLSIVSLLIILQMICSKTIDYMKERRTVRLEAMDYQLYEQTPKLINSSDD
ncbi:hypothetical protein AKO1_015824 [Acrasis kona]|uniref:Allorecognition 2 n=1 Tax=Acrasis kona TaxID=1008807 RepID=A0AAW2ZIE4_9EUKA